MDPDRSTTEGSKRRTHRRPSSRSAMGSPTSTTGSEPLASHSLVPGGNRRPGRTSASQTAGAPTPDAPARGAPDGATTAPDAPEGSTASSIAPSGAAPAR